jgi:wobble nucleotide-excising tRNase
MANDNKRQAILDRAKEAHKKFRLGARQDLVDAINEAVQAGITYQEIGEALGVGKTAISQFLSRSK